MINEVALVLLIGLFGWKVALIYVFTGLTIAILAGLILEKLKLKRYVADWVYETHAKQRPEPDNSMSLNQRISAGGEVVREIVGKIWIYILIGIAVGAGAHGFVPDEYLAGALGSQNWYSVPLAGIIPIVSVLIEKGVTLGTALAFMMSVIGLSLPEIIILKKVLKWQLIGVFIGVVAAGIVIVGLIFNYIAFI